MTRREWNARKERKRRLELAKSLQSDCKDVKSESAKVVIRELFKKKPDPAVLIVGACCYGLFGLCETWVTGKVIPNI